MNKRGIILVISLLVVLVLATLLASLYFQAISETQLARRYVNSTRAFWLAEAGVAKALEGLSGPGTVSGYLDQTNYTYAATMSLLSGNYYRIESTGSVVSGGSTVAREVEVTVRTGVVDPSKFQFSVSTTTDFKVIGGGGEGINKFIEPDNSFQENAVLDFADLFGLSKANMRDGAGNLYTDATSFNVDNAQGVTWVDVKSGEQLQITGGSGEGVLIINGDVKITGDMVLNGIIYVIGKLTMLGNCAVNGAVLAESSTAVDTTLGGSTLLTYDIPKITSSLEEVQFLTKEVVSWQEI